MSNIYFRRIKIKNFMSYDTAELRLDTPGYILVKGENHNPEDSASSNGCGKSTIFNAIVWAITGHTVTGLRDVSNIYLPGETYAEIEFECNSKVYVIKRSKSPSNLKIFINGEDMSGKGTRDSEKLLKEYLPEITDSLINSVIILGQGLPQRFTNNTPAGRKEVLENLSKSDFMIDDIKQRLANRKEMLSLSLREYENNFVENDGKIDVTKLNLLSLEGEFNRISDTDSLKEELTILSEKLANESAKKNSLISEQQVKLEKSKLITEELLNIQKNKDEELKNLELEDTFDISNLIHEVEWEIKSKAQEIARLEAVSDICPTCGQKLPNVVKIDTTPLKEEIENLKLDYETYKDMLSKALLENKQLTDEIANKYALKQAELNDELTDCNKRLVFLNSEIISCTNDIQIYSNEISSKNARLEAIDKDIEELRVKIEDQKQLIEALTQENIVIDNKIVSINEHLDVNAKMMTAVKRDFRGFLLSNVIDFIDTRCKKYSLEVFGTNNLNFALDGNSISITYDGKEYESLSGGEKQKVDVILQLSIRDMLCLFLNFSSNIIVLDEITDSLDVIGAQKIFNLISNNLNDVETIFIISHHTDFEIPVDGEINIVKGDDKISRIV